VWSNKKEHNYVCHTGLLAQINFRRGGFSFPPEVWHHIIATAMLSSVLVPLVFLFIYRLARLTGYRIRFDNIYHRRRLPS